MKKYNVAVLGATGAVGQEMMKILEERSFPIAELRPLASARSAGKTVTFRGQAVKVQEACDSAFEGIDIVLGAAENDIAEKLARPKARVPGLMSKLITKLHAASFPCLRRMSLPDGEEQYTYVRQGNER